MKKIKSDEYAIRLYNLYCGGLIVISLIVLQAFIPLKPLDLAASISVSAFAVALPLLSGMLIINTVESRYPYGPSRSVISRLTETLFALGVLTAFMGIDAALWHITWFVGALFLIALLTSTTIYSLYVWQLKEKEEELEEKPMQTLQDLARSRSRKRVAERVSQSR